MGGHFVRLKSLPGGWRREKGEQTVEAMVSQRAREEIRGQFSEVSRGSRGGGGGWVSGGSSVEAWDRATPPLLQHHTHTSLSNTNERVTNDRTYKSHLQRTRAAHLRYDKVARVLQLAYRCLLSAAWRAQFARVASSLVHTLTRDWPVRCHLARMVAIELQRNPRHLKVYFLYYQSSTNSCLLVVHYKC
jgi:hypothetical protein